MRITFGIRCKGGRARCAGRLKVAIWEEGALDRSGMNLGSCMALDG